MTNHDIFEPGDRVREKVVGTIVATDPDGKLLVRWDDGTPTDLYEYSPDALERVYE